MERLNRVLNMFRQWTGDCTADLVPFILPASKNSLTLYITKSGAVECFSYVDLQITVHALLRAFSNLLLF